MPHNRSSWAFASLKAYFAQAVKYQLCIANQRAGLIDREGRPRGGREECFRVKGRENFYLTIAEIQRDLDAFMAYYNLERSHQGCRLGCRTPALALR